MGLTATQVVFLLVLGAVAPGFGGCGALAGRGTRFGRGGGFVVATVAAWFGLGLAALLGSLWHPRYPAEGPPEHVATLFVIPGFVLGIAAVRLLAGQPPLPEAGDLSRRRRLARRFLLGLLLAATIAIAVVHQLFVAPVHRALPWSASQVQEWQRDAPGHAYGLTARLPAEEFPAYAAALGLRLAGTGDDAVAWPAPAGPAAWWDPPRVEPGSTWVWRRDPEWLLATQRDGRVWVAAFVRQDGGR